MLLLKSLPIFEICMIFTGVVMMEKIGVVELEEDRWKKDAGTRLCSLPASRAEMRVQLSTFFSTFHTDFQIIK